MCSVSSHYILVPIYVCPLLHSKYTYTNRASYIPIYKISQENFRVSVEQKVCTQRFIVYHKKWENRVILSHHDQLVLHIYSTMMLTRQLCIPSVNISAEYPSVPGDNSMNNHSIYLYAYFNWNINHKMWWLSGSHDSDQCDRCPESMPNQQYMSQWHTHIRSNYLFKQGEGKSRRKDRMRVKF